MIQNFKLFLTVPERWCKAPTEITLVYSENQLNNLFSRTNSDWLLAPLHALVIQACQYDHCIAGQNSPLSRADHKNKAHKHYMDLGMLTKFGL